MCIRDSGKSVRAGHHDVQYYQLRRLLTKRLQQRVAVFKGTHGIAVACEEAMEQLPYCLLYTSHKLPHGLSLVDEVILRTL